jgi:hypothetical protein
MIKGSGTFQFTARSTGLTAGGVLGIAAVVCAVWLAASASRWEKAAGHVAEVAVWAAGGVMAAIIAAVAGYVTYRVRRGGRPLAVYERPATAAERLRPAIGQVWPASEAITDGSGYSHGGVPAHVRGTYERLGIEPPAQHVHFHFGAGTDADAVAEAIRAVRREGS